MPVPLKVILNLRLTNWKVDWYISALLQKGCQVTSYNTGEWSHLAYCWKNNSLDLESLGSFYSHPHWFSFASQFCMFFWMHRISYFLVKLKTKGNRQFTFCFYLCLSVECWNTNESMEGRCSKQLSMVSTVIPLSRKLVLNQQSMLCSEMIRLHWYI